LTQPPPPRIIVDGAPMPYQTGDNILIALLRNGLRPTPSGGCLCLAGDCPHCLATVDGVAYVRTCQTPARAGLRVETWPADDYPPLPATTLSAPEVPARNLHCDVVVIGQGESGLKETKRLTAAGKHVIALDSAAGQEAIGIYHGPLVVARTDAGMLHVHAREEVVVATGASAIQTVAPGNMLPGIVTLRAASLLARAGVPLGRVVAIGAQPEGVDCTVIDGRVLRFEGGGKLEAVVVRTADGRETRFACDTCAVFAGAYPRNSLARMGTGLAVRSIGDAASEGNLPPCPQSGMVCSCSEVDVEGLQWAWDHGFREMELLKRSTLAGTGTCQGGVCTPNLRSFLADRGGALQPAFTARPVARQLTFGEVSAGAFHRPTPRTALDAEHRTFGAQMDRIGGWWRPYRYRAAWQDEYWAVREAVSLGDVSTLGKMQISGPDALTLLERLYPTRIGTIKPGRSKYVLMLDDRGYVFDDGLVCNDGDGRYTLTFTSGGASMAEMWVRDWADAWGSDVRILNQTMSLGAINVTGPLATQLLTRAGLTGALPFMSIRQAHIADVPCRVYRLSFTGETSYELHHPAEHSPKLWRALMALGRDLGIQPHGIEALLKLRLEKGHIIVGQDTDFDSTPRRIQHEWAVNIDKTGPDGAAIDFVGRQAVLRTNKLAPDKQLCALEMPSPAPLEGVLIRHLDGEYAGYVTSGSDSPLFKKAIMLGWVRLKDGALPEQVLIDGRVAQRVSAPFYDKEGQRARA
jgi:glycine cleavage system aminomethyltransferase T